MFKIPSSDKFSKFYNQTLNAFIASATSEYSSNEEEEEPPSIYPLSNYTYFDELSPYFYLDVDEVEDFSTYINDLDLSIKLLELNDFELISEKELRLNDLLNQYLVDDEDASASSYEDDSSDKYAKPVIIENTLEFIINT